MALDRLRRLPDGRFAYRAPRSSWRKDVVPRPREATPPKSECKKDKSCGRHRADGGDRAVNRLVPSAAGSSPAGFRPNRERSSPAQAPLAAALGASTTARPRPIPPPPAPALAALAPILLAPNILAVAHWNRIMRGLLYAASPYLPWAQLLRRSFDVDIEQCSRCGGRIRLIQSVTEPTVARAILERLGLPTEAPSAARARDPTDDDGAD